MTKKHKSIFLSSLFIFYLSCNAQQTQPDLKKTTDLTPSVDATRKVETQDEAISRLIIESSEIDDLNSTLKLAMRFHRVPDTLQRFVGDKNPFASYEEEKLVYEYAQDTLEKARAFESKGEHYYAGQIYAREKKTADVSRVIQVLVKKQGRFLAS